MLTVFSVLISWFQYVKKPSRKKSCFIQKKGRKGDTLKARCNFLSKKISLFQLSGVLIISLYAQTLTNAALMILQGIFAGVNGKGNCRQRIGCGTVAKKNTQTTNLSVLGAGCCYPRTLVILKIAPCANKINFFAECYV